MLVVLGQSAYGYLQMQFVLHHLSHYLHLSLSSIGNYQVGQVGPFFGHPQVSSAYHLLHACIVVGARDGLYIVFPVFLFAWASHSEYHAGRHRILSAYV